MLVLSRKKNQTIHIGNGITIQICEIKGSTVRIGIDAPPEVCIKRGELAEWDEDFVSDPQLLPSPIPIPVATAI